VFCLETQGAFRRQTSTFWAWDRDVRPVTLALGGLPAVVHQGPFEGLLVVKARWESCDTGKASSSSSSSSSSSTMTQILITFCVAPSLAPPTCTFEFCSSCSRWYSSVCLPHSKVLCTACADPHNKLRNSFTGHWHHPPARLSAAAPVAGCTAASVCHTLKYCAQHVQTLITCCVTPSLATGTTHLHV